MPASMARILLAVLATASVSRVAHAQDDSRSPGSFYLSVGNFNAACPDAVEDLVDTKGKVRFPQYL